MCTMKTQYKNKIKNRKQNTLILKWKKTVFQGIEHIKKVVPRIIKNNV